MEYKFIGILFTFSLIFGLGCNNKGNSKDYIEEINLFSGQYSNINMILSDVKNNNGKFEGNFILKKPYVSNSSYQRLIVDYALIHILDLKNVQAIDIYFFLDEEEQKQKYQLQYSKEEYKLLNNKFKDERIKKAAELCFATFNEAMPYDIDLATETVIFLRMPEGKYEYQFIDIFFYEEFEQKLIKEKGKDKLTILTGLKRLYDIGKVEKSNNAELNLQNKKISAFIDSLSIILN